MKSKRIAPLSSRNRERFHEARVRGTARAKQASAVIDVRYSSDAEALVLVFRSGGSMTIPRRLIPGLEGQPTSALEPVSVSPAGDSVLWTSLDADVYVPGLVERAFGNELVAVASGRRGLRRRSKAKAAAARRNGAKGGRPRKNASA